MRTAVVCVGDELLKGFTVNTNLTDLGKELLTLGISPEVAITIPDAKSAIAGELERQLDDGMDLIILSGGLGPTLDDLTKQVVAGSLGLSLRLNDGVMEKLSGYWERRGVPIPKSASNQALVPDGAEWLPNDVGTAPGLVLKVKRGVGASEPEEQLVVMLPGPPGEFVPMVREYLIPYLSLYSTYEKSFTRTVVVAGMPESKVEKMTAHLIPEDMSIAYCASPACVCLYLSGANSSALETKECEIRGILGDKALLEGIESPVEQLLEELRKRSMTIAVAESCTGGMIGAALTSFPSASDVFKGGYIVYSNELKTNLLGVPVELLDKFGAVSPECAEAMARNLVRKLDVDAGIAVTGIAGPGGGTQDKPLGLVYVGISLNGTTIVEKFHFPGDRARVRERALYSSVNALLSEITSTG